MWRGVEEEVGPWPVPFSEFPPALIYLLMSWKLSHFQPAPKKFRIKPHFLQFLLQRIFEEWKICMRWIKIVVFASFKTEMKKKIMDGNEMKISFKSFLTPIFGINHRGKFCHKTNIVDKGLEEFACNTVLILYTCSFSLHCYCCFGKISSHSAPQLLEAPVPPCFRFSIYLVC